MSRLFQPRLERASRVDKIHAEGYNPAVYIRKSLVTLVLLLLFSMSCWACSCDLTCSLDDFGGCEETSTAQPDLQQTAPMQANMSMVHGHCKGVGQAGLRSNSSESCTHVSCNEPAISTSVPHGVGSTRLSSMPAVAVVFDVAKANFPGQWTQLQDSPPRICTADPLSIALRL